MMRCTDFHYFLPPEPAVHPQPFIALTTPTQQTRKLHWLDVENKLPGNSRGKNDINFSFDMQEDYF